jgi:RNA polymerase sigma-70 factor (ECF subfamily)
MNRTDPTSQSEKVKTNQSIENLVREQFSYVQRLALSILDDPHEAEDAAQEAFISASRNWSRFRGASSPRTWLTTITVNACRCRLRKRKSRQGLLHVLQAFHLAQTASFSMEEAAMHKDSCQAVREAVSLLDEKHRLPVLLRYVHELSVPEIAEVLHTNPGTIYSRLYYARKMLMARLEPLNPHKEVRDETHSNPVT